MNYLFELLAILGAAAICGVVKLWRDVATLQTKMQGVDARFRKIDEMKLEASMAEIKAELRHIRALLEGKIYE